MSHHGKHDSVSVCEIMSNFELKHSEVVRPFLFFLFLFLSLSMENVTDRDAVFTAPDERPKPLPVFSTVQTQTHTFNAEQEDLNLM